MLSSYPPHTHLPINVRFRGARLFYTSLVVYLLLAIGSVLPTSMPVEVWLILIILSSPAFFFRLQAISNELSAVILRTLPLALILLMSLMRSEHLDYAIQKIDGAVLVTLISATLAGVIVRIYSREVFLSHFLSAMIFILVSTIMYKTMFGFWDRGIRYFINGPIVFGWMMSSGAIISLILFQKTTRKKYFVLYTLLFCSVLWSLSKGPLIALAASSFFVLLKFGRFSQKVRFAFGAIVAVLILMSIIPVEQFERFSAISRLVSGATTSADAGSLDSRQVMISQTIEMVRSNLLFGVGLGNWQDHAGYFGHYVYPHNIYLEIFSETGVISGIVFLILLGYLWLGCSMEGKAVSLVFLIGSLFSGDAAYLRLSLTMLIAFRRRGDDLKGVR